MFVEVIQQNCPNIIIGCVYRPPISSVIQCNLAMIKIIDIIGACPSKLSFIVGDIIRDLHKSNDHTLTVDCLSNMMSHSFLSTIHYPIRKMLHVFNAY